MIRTSRRLADGREIVYYDREPAPRDAEDTRDLPPVSTRSQLRYDALLGEWVAIASHRQTRTFLPPADECPLDPSRPGRPTEIPESSYQVVVFENRFPSLATGVDRDVPPTAPGAPLAELRPGFGRCEVVCFTDDHDRVFAELGHERARLVVDAWADRTAVLGAIDGVEYVFPFENHGEEIGVTLSHPHGQIYAYPYLPPRAAKILDSVRRADGDLFAEVVESERKGPRVVAENEHWTAFVPAAARWPYEVQLFPTRRVPDLPALDDAQRDGFVDVYLDVLGRFARRFDSPMPYIAAWNQAPVREGRDEWWLHLQLFSIRRAPGKLKYLAGSESGMGAFITDTNPEDVAEQLRAVVVGRVSDQQAAEAARAAFARRFGTGPAGVWAAPGRVNVIGEHTDYNGGFVLPMALPHTTRAAVAPRSDGVVAFSSLQQPEDDVELPLAELRPGRPDGWAGYPAGVVAELREAVTAAGGLSVLVDSDVPAGAGLSSSAALECAVALAVRDLCATGLGPDDLVDVARRAENDFVGAPTGILDQSASVLCTAGHALFLDTRDRSSEQVPFDLAATGLALLVVDTGQTHEHAGGGYGDRRRECEEAAARLGVGLLREVDDVAALAVLDDGTDEGSVLLRRARHIVTEDARVLEVVDVLRSGADVRAIGPVLTAGHASLRDDFGMSSDLLDLTVEAALAAGAYGARMVGGGFGGSAIALVDADRVDEVTAAVTARFGEQGAPAPRTFVAVPSAGARRLI